VQGEASVLAPARLLIADDHVLVREGMRTMLAREPGFEIIGEAENGREALELCRRLRPDLVLMDVRMPEMDGLQATRAIKQECPATVVLMVTSYENPEYMLDAIRAGAAGYVLKEATRQELLGAVKRVLEGEFPFDHEPAMRLLRHLADPPPGRQGGWSDSIARRRSFIDRRRKYRPHTDRVGIGGLAGLSRRLWSPRSVRSIPSRP
jgi:DNA-binding NarL/FixJ family response regulator